MAGVYHFMVLDGTILQATATYFSVSLVSVALVGASAWVGALTFGKSRADASGTEQELELEAWQDWMIEEEAELESLFEQNERSAPEDFIAPKRKSA